jgi:DNA-binding LacI/PurR family transcriptional regulator
MVALDFGVWHDYLSDMFFVELTRGIQDALEAHEFGTVLSGPGQALNRWVKTRAVDGLIVVGSPADDRALHQISSAGTPCVVVGNRATTGIAQVGSVVVGLRRGVKQAAQLLTERGHRRIGFLATDFLDDVCYEFRAALEALGGALPDASIVLAGHAPGDGARGLCELLARPDPPTAVLARSDGIAIGALRACHRMKLRVPADLSIIGHDDVPFAEWTEPPLTTVRVHSSELGRLAADTLFDLMAEPETALEPRVIDTELVVRDSVGEPRLWALSLPESVRLASHQDAAGTASA